MNQGTPGPERARTILLVEDEPLTRSYIQRFLERDGHEVIAVDAAEEGIVEASEVPPDVLISDIHLPGLSGIELTSFLLAQDPGLPVILMTGDPDEELARRAMACGPVQYVLKPFEWFEMQAAVRFALGLRDAASVPAPEPVVRFETTSDEPAPPFGAVIEIDADPVPAHFDDPVAGFDVPTEDEVLLELAEDAVVYLDESAGSRTDDPDQWLERADRDSFAGPGHGDRVARIALALLAEMPEPAVIEASDLALAARVHEVGRLHLPDGDPVDIATRGAEVLAETGFPATVAETIRHMHERWDGTAGPAGLSGHRIPAGARLLAAADAIDHYVSAWIRSGLDPERASEKAMQLVTVQQNRAFCPTVVGAMYRASDTLLHICAQDGARQAAQPMPVPAMAAAEAVPFALFSFE